MSIWDDIKRYADAGEYLPGMTFATSLLGRVLYDENFESIIPPELQKTAMRNGFRIVAADYTDNTYVLRVMRTSHE
jgi:hypothetical protein